MRDHIGDFIEFMLNRIQQIGVVCALKKLKHTLFPASDAKNICARNGAFEYLQRYAYAAKNKSKETQIKPGRKVIWTCWLQGIENAPKLVQKCVASMRQYSNGYDVIVIDNESVSNYVQLPDYIQAKYAKGIIPHAHYSDIIRLFLLQKYGGVWIDSTILLTGTLPDYITDAELFVFRGYRVGQTFIYNPFLAAQPNHPIIHSLLNLLLEYWKKENKLVSYSIFHLCFTMAVEASNENRALWEQVPFSYGSQMFYLQPQLGKPYSEQAYQLATQLSSIHKLTYKFEQFGIDINKKGTFYDVLINGNKPC